MSIALLTLGLGNDALAATLSGAIPSGKGGSGTAANGILSGAAVAALVEDLPRLHSPPPGTSDALLQSVEKDFSRRLAAVVDGPGMAEVRAKLARLKSAGDVTFAVEARTDTLRHLPWELLDPRLCRVEPSSRRAESPADALEVLVWSPEAPGPVVAAVGRGLAETLQGLRDTVRVALPAELPMAPPPSEGAWRVLHVLTGDIAALSRLPLRNGWLSGLLSSVGLVFLDAPVAQELPGDLPRQLLAGGAAAVVSGRLGPEASVAFSRAFYPAIAAGGTLPEAMAAGRRAVAALALPHPGSRAWNLQLHLPSEHAGAPLGRVPVPGPWPRASTEANALLERALDLGRPHGFVGVEHLSAVLALRPGPAQPTFQAVAATLAAGDTSAELKPSPRLEAIAASLPAGFEVEDLSRAILAIPWVQREAGRKIPPTVGTGRGLGFEVTGGPDDGRQVRLSAAGQVLGRWDPETGTDDGARLFSGGGAWDRTVSRKHLVFRGWNKVAVVGPTRVARGEEAPKEVTGEVTLQVGDRLWLGAATRLLVVSA